MEREAFEAKVTEIARLGHYQVKHRHAFSAFVADLSKGDEDIVISTGTHKASGEPIGRFRVQGRYPQPENKRLCVGLYSIKPVIITMTETKTAEQMWKEIERRFLPKYLEQLEMAVKLVKEKNEDCRQRYETLNTLKQAIDGKPTAADIVQMSHADYIFPEMEGIYQISVASPECVMLDLSSLPLDKALKLVEFMKGLLT